MNTFTLRFRRDVQAAPQRPSPRRKLLATVVAALSIGSVAVIADASPALAWPAPNAGLCYNWTGTLRTSTANQGEPAKALQRALNYLLPTSLTVDGYYGSGTTAAVKTFQTRNALTSDGIAGTNTFAAIRNRLGCNVCYNWTGVYRQSSTNQGEPVKALQRALNVLNPAALAVDGYYGSGTTAAVKTFQTKNGLVSDGIAGPNTFSKIRSKLGCPVTPPSTTTCPTAPVAIDQTTLARGFRVHTCIATKVTQMIDAAAAAGISLTGWAWRDQQTQIQLRIQNCGGDIWTKPASECSPPTAIPGTSRHERGLAIDFDRASNWTAKFNWLKANAAKYGFYNLPSESWHWSTDGH